MNAMILLHYSHSNPTRLDLGFHHTFFKHSVLAHLEQNDSLVLRCAEVAPLNHGSAVSYALSSRPELDRDALMRAVGHGADLQYAVCC